MYKNIEVFFFYLCVLEISMFIVYIGKEKT